ncbi:iron reductase [Arthrobacter sp. AQ5-05]|uniref:ferric reductase-like transmembrane domain-containing protein n=1 Tax=Arthrobacter sp. AQ5-05 TaxID=2184581 RepID=UPI000DCEE8F5|nr:ferric reductase-like transmembrane domain-containing protein [Arthrobacter sp. AQ5-05]RAX48666.1 iron reductase [Arthrobacter sp. AQ5-05]
MDSALWALGRASGIVSLAMFTVTVLLGIVNRSGRPLPAVPRFSVALIHRNISLLATLFLLMHIGSLMLDSYAKLNLVDVFVPFLGSFKPFWQGLGTVAFDLLVAMVLTGLLRHRLGQRTFRAVHWFAYAMWPIALAHSIGNGTNGTERWFLALAAGSFVAVGGALAWRLSLNFLENAKTRQRSLS